MWVGVEERERGYRDEARHHDHNVRLWNDFTSDHIPDEPSGATCHG